MRYLLPALLLVTGTSLGWAQSPDSADPATRGQTSPRADAARPKPDALDRLQDLPKPAAQKDIDTFQLASAHRERAASVQEKTDGLWQSWLVSICEGCGPERRPFTDDTAREYLRKLRAQGAPEHQQGASAKPRYTYYYPPSDARSRKPSSLANNLDNHVIDQIRRDPNR